MDAMWQGVLALVPVALAVALLCRILPCRPATRFGLWFSLLLLMAAGPVANVARPTLLDLLPSDAPAAEAAAPRPAIAPPAPPDLRTAGPYPRTASHAPSRETAVSSARGVERSSLVPAGAAPPGSALRPSAPLEPPPQAASPGPAVTGRAAEPFRGVSSAQQPPSTVAMTPQWRALAQRARSILMSVPPLPGSIWLGGAALTACCLLTAIARTARLVRRSQPAPAAVVALVAGCARDLGLRRVPATRMIDRRISPLVWCGRAPCLLLPTPLWAQLDDIGRRAVVCHELAHLRRRDHWVLWADIVVGCLYWWNPLVWWIRHRLREEADLSCDAWVTALLPTSRRAYAEALLETRRLQCDARHAALALGLGVSGFNARRFARRLTMVMTFPTSKRRAAMSARGLALVGCVGMCGLLVTPLLACPPDEAGKPAQPTPAAPKAPRAPKAPKAPKAPRAPAPGAPGPGPHGLMPRPGPMTRPAAPGAPGTTFEQFMERHEQPNRSLEERLEELERRLHELMQRLERMGHDHDAMAPGPEGMANDMAFALSEIKGLDALRALELDHKAQLEALHGDLAGQIEATRMQELAQVAEPLTYAFQVAPPGDAGTLLSKMDCDKVFAKSYTLPKGKLEAITALMVRDDVPILVSPRGDRLEVQATATQHQIFEAFCTMLDSKDGTGTYSLPSGKLEALTALMRRDDVPILIEPQGGAIKVHGTDLERAVFEAFVNLIHPQRSAAAASADTGTRMALGRAVAPHNHAAQMNRAQQQMEILFQQAERVRQQALELAEQAQVKEVEADELEVAAEDAAGPRRDHMLARSSALRAAALALEAQAEALEDQAEALEDQAEQLEEQVEELSDQIEEEAEVIEEPEEPLGAR
jgi:beta-lactamase regulating signal transducer with metallopeptidase domain